MSDPAKTAPGRPALGPGVDGMVIALAGAFMLLLTFATWPHPIVDFGRELYVPWRLSEGDVLYRDLAYLNGPLSPYWNSLVFQIFGVGLNSLVGVSMLTTAGLTALLYSLLVRVGSRFSGTIACLFFVSMFAFGQIDSLGNDSYLTPYSHEATHGLLLSLAALALLSRPARPRSLDAGLAGFALGLVFLTKSELFLAAALACALGLALEARHRGAMECRGRAAALALGLALPVAASVLLLSAALPFSEAIRGTLGSWTSIFIPELGGLHYDRANLGLLGLGENLRTIAFWLFGYLAYAGVLTLIVFRMGGRRDPDGAAADGDGDGDGEGDGDGDHETAASVALVALPSGVVIFCLVALLDVPWHDFVRPLPVVLGLLLPVLLRDAWRRSPRAEALETSRLRTMLVTFALVLLGKIALRASLTGYGFALAMPGTMVLLVLALDWWPKALTNAKGKWILRGANLGVLLVISLWLGNVILAHAHERTNEVGQGRDRFRAGPVADIVNPVLMEIELLMEPEETLAVLPEGVMFNYLTRRVNPTGYINFMPPQFVMFGEDAMLDAFAEAPPDWIVLLSRDVDEYGFEGFGVDYGVELGAWVSDHYRVERSWGATPDRWPDGEFGVQLLQRKGRP